MFYQSQLKALKRVDRFRQREIFDDDLVDFASNDYLGLSKRVESLDLALDMLKESSQISPKASMVVNGYSKIHKNFEETLSSTNGFEDGVVVGSGYLANIALVEALVRKGDAIFIDKEFHSSGVLATKLIPGDIIWFEHNDPENLKSRLKNSSAKRKIILVEGIYSMSGDTLKKEFFDIANEFEAILVVDEAHSSGVLGKNLLGVYEYYGVEIMPNHIKMGTLGKAYGSYGAYILASNHIISYLINRAKPIIYSTALSLFDTALAMVNFEYIYRNKSKLNFKLQKRRDDLKKYFGQENDSLILSLEFKKDKDVKSLQKTLLQKGFLVGAIRRPTVLKPILRIIPNIGVDDDKFLEFVDICKEQKII
jgi:8-amino-7-oxononanoate synthase